MLLFIEFFYLEKAKSAIIRNQLVFWTLRFINSPNTFKQQQQKMTHHSEAFDLSVPVVAGKVEFKSL